MIKLIPNDCCPECGCDLVCESEYEEEGLYTDGEKVWCVNCNFTSYISLHEDGYIIPD